LCTNKSKPFEGYWRAVRKKDEWLNEYAFKIITRMEQPNIHKPLNATQLEILKLFSREMEEKDLIEIKRLIVNYLAEKATKLADEAWEKKGWFNEDMDKFLQLERKNNDNNRI
jgi:hypothetical protein